MAQRLLFSSIMAPAARSHPLGDDLWRIVQEVLDGVLTPSRLDEVVRDALDGSGRDQVPESPEALASFVDGALFAALVDRLDVADAAEIAVQIRASLALALQAEERPPGSHVRAVRPRRPERILVVSRASLVVFLLQEVLRAHVEVVEVTDEPTLRAALRAGPPSLVLVDRKHPRSAFDATEALVDEMGPWDRLVFWGPPDEAAALQARLAARDGVEVLDRSVPLADVGERCRAIVAP